MLGNKTVMATVAVKDAEAARKFYEQTLGLEIVGREQPGVFAFKCGGSEVLVYESEFAGSNKATAATWNLGKDIEKEVTALVDKGVRFERYDMPELELKGDVYCGHGMKVAWFKDPDGNIHALTGT